MRITVPDDLRSRIAGEEFDYLALLNALKDYARPRDRITLLLRQGEIVRVKKGIYVFGEGSRLRPFSPEVLANRLFGPSYVSLESALWRHGLIPERPEAVTAGTVRLVGTDRERIVAESTRLLDNPQDYQQMSQAYNPYGDGQAAARIVQILGRSESR